MRAVELGKVAAQAEKIRLGQIAKRQALRVVFALVAAVFALGVLVLLHVLGYQLLVGAMRPVFATLVLLVVDLVILITCGVLAMRNAASQVEIDARLVRDQALVEMRSALSLMSLIAPVGAAIVGRRGGRSALVGALATRLLSRR